MITYSIGISHLRMDLGVNGSQQAASSLQASLLDTILVPVGACSCGGRRITQTILSDSLLSGKPYGIRPFRPAQRVAGTCSDQREKLDRLPKSAIIIQYVQPQSVC